MLVAMPHSAIEHVPKSFVLSRFAFSQLSFCVVLLVLVAAFVEPAPAAPQREKRQILGEIIEEVLEGAGYGNQIKLNINAIQE